MSTEIFLSSLTPQSTMAELPAWDVRLPVTARGSELDEMFRRDGDLPGVVVFDATGVRGAISRAQFQNVISRPFGGEIVRPRALGTLLGELAPGPLMVLDVNLPIQEALRRSLGRDKSLIYEPVLVSEYGDFDVRLVAFNDLLRADSRISALRNQQMREILATVQEGFLLVDRDHCIASEVSRSVETIFGRADAGGRLFPTLLRELAGDELADLARAYLETLFNPNVIENLVADINPLQAVQVPEREGRPRQHLRFTFRRSTEGREIRRVLVRVEDRTREVELAAELEEQGHQAAQRVDLAMEMMQVEPGALTDYLTRFFAEVAQVARLRAQRGPAGATLDAIFRILHSLKGEAGVIGLRSFARSLHAAEDAAAALRDGNAAALDPLDAPIESLRALGAEAKDLIVRLSALRVIQSRPFDSLRSLRAGSDGEGTPADGAVRVHPRGIPRSARDDTRRPPDLVTALESLVAELSARLGKPARVVAHWNPSDLPSEYAAVVREALIQLARNAMVHGVELEAERRRAGKPVPAVLQFALRRHEEQLEIIFQDDGRGLDLERIPDPQTIFEPGFSTAESVTGDAGRGVGLDLVKENVERLGGMIFVHSEPGVFCAFQIVLPLEVPA